MHHHNQRHEVLKRVLVYIAMTIAVAVLVVACLFFVLGYSVNEKTGKAEQGGLIQYRSFPNNTKANLDGALISTTTPTKTNASAGFHSVGMDLAKYRSWKKNVTLARGELLWLNALLIPSSLTTTSVKQFTSLGSFVAAPDKKWIAIIQEKNKPVLTITDLRDEKKPIDISLKIPDALIGALRPDDQFSIHEWDFGSRYILVQRTNALAIQWLRIDRADIKNTKNITAQLGIADLSSPHFSGTSGNILYGLSAGTIRKLDLGQSTISSPIASNVVSYELYKENDLVYIALKDTMKTVAVRLAGESKATIVRSYKEDVGVPVNASLTDYFEDTYVAISRGEKVEIIQNPTTSRERIYAHLTLKPGVSWLYFSNNGQYIVAQNGATLASYDLERKKSYQFTIPGNVAYTSSERLQWLDDFHFWSDAGGILQVFEFDGDNTQTLGAVAPGYDVTLSSNGKRLFSVGVTADKPVLQSSVMVIE